MRVNDKVTREVLIIGGTGFIGAAICREFLNVGDTVTLLHRTFNSESPVQSNLFHILGDRANPPAELKKRYFDLVIDTCGYSPTDLSILESITTQHYIFISSVAVFSKSVAPLATESAPKIDQDGLDLSDNYRNLNKHERYGILKLECEKVLRLNFESSSIVRPCVVLGEKDNTGRLDYLYNLPKQNASIPLSLEKKFQHIDVRDLAKLIVLVGEQLPGNDFNLVGPSIEWQEFVETFTRIFQIDDFVPSNDRIEFPFWDNYPNAGIRSLSSKHSWISQHKFIALSKSLEQFRLQYKSTME